MKTSRSVLSALAVLSLALGGCAPEQDGSTGDGGAPGTDTATTGDAGSAGSGGSTGTGGAASTGGDQGGSAGNAGSGGAGTGGAGGAGGGSVAETVDPDATAETQALFVNLRNLAPKSTLIGMQDATTEGDFMVKNGKVDWAQVDGVKSDIREVTGKGPAMYGFDVAAVVGDYWLADPNKDQLAKTYRAEYTDHMKKLHARGGVVTMSWHQANPITNVDPKHGPHELWQVVPPDACGDVKAVDAGVQNCGAHFADLKAKVDVLADFFEGLKDADGKPIPVVFRPFHENSGGWFWWGCDDKPTAKYHASLRAVWSWMVHYMKDVRHVHQLLWAISPNGKGRWGTRSAEEYTAITPGLDLVDVLGYDYYDSDMKYALPELRTIVDLANQHGKIAAMTEGSTIQGVWDGWTSDEWSKYIVGPIVDDDKARGIGYMMFWYNRPNSNHWGPYKAHKSAADFATLCDRPDVLLEGDVDLYKAP